MRTQVLDAQVFRQLMLQLLVERVDIGLEGLSLRLRVDGLAGLVGEMTLERAA